MLSYADLDADQLDCISFCMAGDDALLAADVGTGKTVIAESVALEALTDARVTRWLVLAPLLVADEVWRDEHTFWSHLQGLSVAIATGDEAQRLAAIESDAEVVVLNYENVAWLMEKYPLARNIVDGKRVRKSTLPFDGLICDEIDKFKEVTSKRFKAFRDAVPYFNMRLCMTGTIMPNHLLELWGQMFIVDGGQTWGRSYYKWRDEYFYAIDYNRYDWRPLPGSYERILADLDGIVYRLKAKGLPEVIVERPDVLEMTIPQAAIYKELHKALFTIVTDKKGKQRKVDADNRAVLSGKLQQICAGFSYVDAEVCRACGGEVKLDEKKKRRCVDCNKPAKPDVVWHNRARFIWLQKKLAELAPEPVLIFYHFVEEFDELVRMYPDIRSLGSSVSKNQKRATVAAWNNGDLGKLALHPGSAGHGLNLQKGGACNIIFLTWPWSGGMYKQVTGRLARRGNPSDTVSVWGALFRGTIDGDVMATATGKVEGLENFLDDLWQNDSKAISKTIA